MSRGLCDGEVHYGRRRPPSIILVGTTTELCDSCNEARLSILMREAIRQFRGKPR